MFCRASRRAQPPAMPSFKSPHTPLGSAAVIAIPATIGLERSRLHSSAVKVDLSAIANSALRAREVQFHRASLSLLRPPRSPCVLVATLPAAHTAVAALDGNRAAIGARRDIDARSPWADTNADTCAGNDHAGTAIARARWTAVVEPLICADRWWAGNIAATVAARPAAHRNRNCDCRRGLEAGWLWHEGLSIRPAETSREQCR